MPVDEHTLYTQIAQFMQYQYPNVLYRFDLAADLKLTPIQASRHKALHPRRGHPDMFISEPKHYFYTTAVNMGAVEAEGCYHGLYLELKKDGEKLYPGKRAKKRYTSKDGFEYKTEHLMEQADYLYDLRNKKYVAEFAVGFDEATKIISAYLGEPHKEKVEF